MLATNEKEDFEMSTEIRDAKGQSVRVGDTLKFTSFDLNGRHSAYKIATGEDAVNLQGLINEYDGVIVERPPLYKDETLAEVGHKVKRTDTDVIKEIIRIDTSTRQVWFKKGGFEWLEDMKNYQEV